jgi:hypothetical protein
MNYYIYSCLRIPVIVLKKIAKVYYNNSLSYFEHSKESINILLFIIRLVLFISHVCFESKVSEILFDVFIIIFE